MQERVGSPLSFCIFMGSGWGRNKNPIDMWIDDYVSLVTIEAIAMEEIIKQREVLKKETFREYWERTRGEKIPTSC